MKKYIALLVALVGAMEKQFIFLRNANASLD